MELLLSVSSQTILIHLTVIQLSLDEYWLCSSVLKFSNTWKNNFLKLLHKLLHKISQRFYRKKAARRVALFCFRLWKQEQYKKIAAEIKRKFFGVIKNRPRRRRGRRWKMMEVENEERRREGGVRGSGERPRARREDYKRDREGVKRWGGELAKVGGWNVSLWGVLLICKDYQKWKNKKNLM